jgi:hypothetical protein
MKFESMRPHDGHRLHDEWTARRALQWLEAAKGLISTVMTCLTGDPSVGGTPIMKSRVSSGLILWCVLAASFSVAADIPDAALTPLKQLVGEWKGVDSDGKPHKVLYQWASGGTSLTETLTPPDSPPMTTIYYTDGDQLMLTHYCSLNNQPRMRANAGKEGDKVLAFAFVDATNLKNQSDPHMHQMTIELKDHDHFTQTWVLSKAGKDIPKIFTFERVK